MAGYKSDGSGGRSTTEGSAKGRADAGGGNRGNRDRDRGGGAGGTGARGKDQMDAKTKKALADAFGATGQASRQNDTPTNERNYRDANRDTTPNDLPPGLNPLAYSENPTNTVAPTPHNLMEIARRAIPGPGMVAGAINDIAQQSGVSNPLADALGIGTGFEGPQGQTTTGERNDHAPGKDVQDDEFDQPTQPVTPAKPPAEVPVNDLWEYPDEETDQNAGAPQDGLSDEERRRRGNTSIVVLGQGGLAI